MTFKCVAPPGFLLMPGVTAAKKAGVILVKFPEEEGGWSQAVIAKIVPSGDPVEESGTHYEGALR